MCDQINVKTSHGILRGKRNVNKSGKIYFSYNKIPYAKSPINDLRFKPPQKLDHWEYILDATEYGNNCAASKWFLKEAGGCEDCLFLNIYVPINNSSSLLPVMFWIHGGGFVVGSGNLDVHGADYLMDYDIVLVTINYRLGPLGFLNLELEEAPGNVGLMDQVAALKWVNENILNFGGDPQNITIAGTTAGAASVHYHILSDLTNGLFHKAIVQSGSAFNPWAFQKDPVKNALRLCEALGYSTQDTNEALTFLKKIPLEKLLSIKLSPVIDGQILDDFIFVPSVEKEFPGHKPFLTATPWNKMKSGTFNRVPLMTGYNSAEGNLFFMYLKQESELLQKFENDFKQFIPNDLLLSLEPQASIKLAKEIRKFYFKDKPIQDNIQKLVDVLSDNWFTRGIDDFVKIAVKEQNDPVFYYVYDFDEYSPSRHIFGDYGIKGAGHGDDVANLFKSNSNKYEKEGTNIIMTQKRMLKMWTNFIKYSNPTPSVNDLLTIKWKPATQDELNYLQIGSNLTLSTDPAKDRMKFWAKATNDTDHK